MAWNRLRNGTKKIAHVVYITSHNYMDTCYIWWNMQRIKEKRLTVVKQRYQLFPSRDTDDQWILESD